jgi:hypothetical protein
MSRVGFVLWGLGAFLDWHPSFEKGVHARLELTYSTLEVSRQSQFDIDDPAGFSFGAAVGYDFELADGVTFGPVVHLTGAPLTVDEGLGDIDVDVLLPSLLLTATLR